MSEPAYSDQPRPERIPFVKLAKGQEVSLGCGTLILIAIIVAICSGAGNRTTDLSPVLSRLDQLDRRIQQLETKIDELSKRLADK
jgi:hypothetical protein